MEEETLAEEAEDGVGEQVRRGARRVQPQGRVPQCLLGGSLGLADSGGQLRR